MSTTATVYDGATAHSRTEPLVNRFRYRVRMWLVDLADLPVAPRPLHWAMQFDAADHVGDPGRSIQANITAVFEADGIDTEGCRIVMLASPRGLGHAFNPISVHWLMTGDGSGGESVRAVVAEVHNTYGGRHAYVLRPDERGRDTVAKQLYVSPFYATDGHYTISVSEPGDRIAVSVTLHPEHGNPFVATLKATRRAPAPVARAAVRSAADSWRTSVLIRWQGVRLWARKLPVQKLPEGHDRELSEADLRYRGSASENLSNTESETELTR